MYPEEDQVDSARLPHVMAAICETQRIRSIVPVGIPHGCLKVPETIDKVIFLIEQEFYVPNKYLQDTVLGNYVVPKGAMVIPLQWAMHLDPKVWKDPEEFKPSRFLSSDATLLKPQEFIPFQTGSYDFIMILLILYLRLCRIIFIRCIHMISLILQVNVCALVMSFLV